MFSDLSRPTFVIAAVIGGLALFLAGFVIALTFSTPATAQDFCVGQPDDTPCDDDNYCTDPDWCQSEVCIGAPLPETTPCDDGDECTVEDRCDGMGTCEGIPVVPVCGDLEVCPPEECDDGNTEDGDGCSSTCQDEFCGDTIVQPGLGEECDDGNTEDGDGCSSTCQVEAVPSPVGGIGELPDAPGSSGSNYAVLAGAIATAVVALTAGAWYARRRWVR
jgi:cysteine-rich repeat protein